MERVRRDSGSELIRAIRARIADFVCTVAVERSVSRAWASATFSGARHEFQLRIEGEDANAATDAFLCCLADAEFALRGHILADIALISDARGGDGGPVSLRLEALTVEEC